MYEQLAVFLDDDPIPSAALEVLWGVERYQGVFRIKLWPPFKGTVHEKTFFPGKGGLGPSEYESSKKNPIKIKQGAQN